MKPLLPLLCWLPVFGGSAAVRFTPSARSVNTYDYFEVRVDVSSPSSANCFTEATLKGEFRVEGAAPVTVEGFCDALDGTVYRIRYLPAKPGMYSYSVHLTAPSAEGTASGKFKVKDSGSPGIVRVDKDYSFHFIYEGTGGHFFWNSTTAYALVGWDDGTMRKSIDRLARLKINRIRAAFYPPRVEDGKAWFEDVVPTDQFKFIVNPWVAARPDSLKDPGFDVKRFNVEQWRKYERLLDYARGKGIQVSVIFYVDGRRPGADPFGKEKMGNEDEQRYYRYAVARFAAFSNVMWDVTNEWHLFRDEAWVEKMGSLIKAADPYQHVVSCHGRGEFPWSRSTWPDFAMYQLWDDHGGYGAMLERHRVQESTGRPMPQVNEEYGYEDHYPQGWGDNLKPPARSAETRRALAWQISMAGAYQTTGERAGSTGGWINGYGDGSMTMLKGYAHLREFFEKFEYWKYAPHPEFVAAGPAYCLAAPGREYAVYLPGGAPVRLKIAGGTYRARWYNPRTGEWPLDWSATILFDQSWEIPEPPGRGDWALLLQRNED